ncbi:hypothetical protein K439DRAFT_1635684 [Ramaria rubella]|nr:hypothetical protein K439DRAFT_1635684 [Ramaria rubella]
MPQFHRTVTRDLDTIVARGKDAMSFYKPDQSPKPPYPVKVYIAPGSVLEVPPHFHITHDELFNIEEGEIYITQNGIKTKHDASSGEIVIPRGTVHAIYAQAPPDKPIIAWESTNPQDPEKELMFRVMNSVLLDSPRFRDTGRLGVRDILQVNLTFYTYDTRICLLPIWTGKLGRKLDAVVDGILAWMAIALGYQPMYPEYATQELYQSIKQRQKTS